MKKILATTLIVIVVGLLFLVVKGKLGNPQSTQLDTVGWKEEGPFELSPERGRFALLFSLVEDHSFYFSLPVARFAAPDLGYKNGKYVSLFAPLLSYTAVPFYLLGKYLGASQVGVFAVSGFFALLNWILIIKIAQKLRLSTVASFIASTIFLFASPAFAYATTLYQHHVSTFLILASLYLLFFEQSWLACFLIWFFFALSVPLDYPNLFLMFPIAFFAFFRPLILSLTPTMVFLSANFSKLLSLVGVVLPLVFFLWFNFMSYGNALQFSGTIGNARAIDSSGNPTSAVEVAPEDEEWYAHPDEHKRSALNFFQPRNFINGIYIHLFSPDRGIIVFSPVLFLGIIGAIILYHQNSKYTVLLSSVILANILLYSMWGDPWGGWAFGSRYLIPSYAILAIFLGVFLNHFRKNIMVLLIFLVLGCYSVYVNAAGALSTSANPPQVQVLELEKVSGRRERYSWDRNIEFLQAGSSKSFVYQTWLKDKISAWNYFIVIAGSISALILLLTIGLYFSRTSEN